MSETIFTDEEMQHIQNCYTKAMNKGVCYIEEKERSDPVNIRKIIQLNHDRLGCVEDKLRYQILFKLGYWRDGKTTLLDHQASTAKNELDRINFNKLARQRQIMEIKERVRKNQLLIKDLETLDAKLAKTEEKVREEVEKEINDKMINVEDIETKKLSKQNQLLKLSEMSYKDLQVIARDYPNIKGSLKKDELLTALISKL